MCVCAHLYLCVQMCAHLYVSMRGVGVYRWGVHGCTQMCDTPVYVGVGIYMCACECVCVCVCPGSEKTGIWGKQRICTISPVTKPGHK